MVKNRAEDIVEKARDYARRNPGKVIGGAAGVLVGASVVAAAVSRSKSKKKKRAAAAAAAAAAPAKARKKKSTGAKVKK